LSLTAALGHACGTGFKAARHLAQHPDFAWQKGILRDMPARPWTLFTAPVGHALALPRCFSLLIPPFEGHCGLRRSRVGTKRPEELAGMEPTERWTPQVASDLYDVASWGKGYFSVSDGGHVRVSPGKGPRRSIDLKELVDTLVLARHRPPHPHTLRRYPEATGWAKLHAASDTAIAEHKYQGGYCCVYPSRSTSSGRWWETKSWNSARPFHFGLEAGSKPELMAVMALADNDTPIICNGFQGRE